ncbi:hypothetical protein CMV_017686 [Castanea mollissima]|uniref:beta-galactosidase n=1 Tax=Castanea mollissima TaxID=60419 RepID=A0A8J4QSD2_9ROSI|nr:hypothetical protein CMV_017686 [Castanea mollissima]
METHSVSKLPILLLMVLYHGSELTQCSVTYDKKAILINGQRRILISGSIRYPRSTPEMWEDLIQKAKDGGLDVIDTYVFWNVHEPSPGNYELQNRNEPFKTAMQGFTQKIVQMMKNERLFASQGGLIILSQKSRGRQMKRPTSAKLLLQIDTTYFC